MHFHAAHDFDATPAAVQAAMTEPDVADHLAGIPDVAPPSLVSRVVDGTTVVVQLHFRYTGQLDPLVRKVVGDRISWVQEYRITPGQAVAPFTVIPDVGGSVFRCSGTFTFTATGPDHCQRVTDCELTVKVPFVGGRAERALAPAILGRLDGEAAALRTRLAALDADAGGETPGGAQPS